jgi:membrane protein required for beta-lactamase induction
MVAKHWYHVYFQTDAAFQTDATFQMEMDNWNIYLSDKYNYYEKVEKLLILNLFKNYFTVIYQYML